MIRVRGRCLSPGKSIHHDFNSATVNKLNELGQNTSAFMAQVDEKLKELQLTSYNRHDRCNIRCLTSDIRDQMSDIKQQTSDMKNQSDV